MIAQHPYSLAARLLAILAVALAFVFVLTSSAAKPASADASQWTRSQPHWWDQSNAWRNNHAQWRKPWHHRRHFKSSRPRIIVGGSGVILSSPRLVITSPGFIVRQPGFVVRQPGFIVGRPAFVVRQPNFIFERPKFAAKQKQFFKRHPSLRLGQPWPHKSWKHKHWRHPPVGHSPTSLGGVRIIAPGMN